MKNLFKNRVRSKNELNFYEQNHVMSAQPVIMPD